MNPIESIVSRLKEPKILVVGDLMLDHYIWGSVERISPEAPIQILNHEREEFRPGGASNVIANLVSLGASVRCAGVIGSDEEGDKLLELLEPSANVDAIIWDREKPTPVKTRICSHQQQMLRVDREDRAKIRPAVEQALLTASINMAAHCELVILSDYDKGTLTEKFCVDLIRQVNCPVMVGLKGHDYRKYAGATGASLNKKELLALTGEADMEVAAGRLLSQLYLEFLAVTLGSKGIAIYSRKGQIITIPAKTREVFDVSGAGDTVLAALGMAYVSGLTLEECAILANAAAGIEVSKVGTATVTRQELLEDGEIRKTMDLPQLMEAVARYRAKGKTIVFTNGCFDLIHSGHISILEFARSKGDILILGLNSDDSIRRIKGAGRPLIEQEHRAKLLSAFETVNHVIIFDEDTPTELLKAIRPDVLVKGQDYSVDKVIGREYAGRVELAPLVKGLSSSELIRKIRSGSC